MSIVLQNNSGLKVTRGGKLFQIGEVYTIPVEKLIRFQTDEQLIQDITDLKFAVGNGAFFYQKLGDRLAHFFGSDIKQYTAQGIPKMAQYEPEGFFISIASHDFCRKSTWFAESTPITGEELTSETPTRYNSVNAHWIGFNGIQTWEDLYSPSYPTKIYEDGVELPTSAYTVDYEAGKVTFNQAPTGTITADYFAANGSNFVIQPISSDKILRIADVEIQYYKGIDYQPMIQVLHSAAEPGGVPTPQEFLPYKTMRNVIDVAKSGKGFIPKHGDLSDDVMVMPFGFTRVVDLDPRYNQFLTVGIMSGQNMGWTNPNTQTNDPDNGYCTITFYCAEIEINE